MTKRVRTPNYTLELPLSLEPFQIDIINKRLEIARKMYNSILGLALKRYNLMLESKEYRNNKRSLTEINKKFHETKVKKEKSKIDKIRKEIYKDRDGIYLKCGLTNYSLYSDVKPMYKQFKSNIGSLQSQAIADRVYTAIKKLLDGDRVYFKKYGQVDSIENKTNTSCLRYIKETDLILWQGLEIKLNISKNDMYAHMALKDRIKYIRIIRRIIRGKYKYYVQIILEGIPPQKLDKDTGDLKRKLGSGDVGIDIGTQTIAIASRLDVRLLELCPEVTDIDKNKRVILRKLDRQRRINNPKNFEANGEIKQGTRIKGKLTKLKWKDSNKYLKTKNDLKEIQRKQVAIRKQSHEVLANYIISLGDRILVEKTSFKSLQSRAKETTINNKTGRINKKKRFGKSLSNKAPAMLLEIINRKLKYHQLELLKVNTYKVKASQYDHFTDEHIKKKLNERWNDTLNIQRDLYSAFLIKNVDDSLESINRELCFSRYDNFKILHDKEIKTIKQLKINGKKLISSMGI